MDDSLDIPITWQHIAMLIVGICLFVCVMFVVAPVICNTIHRDQQIMLGGVCGLVVLSPVMWMVVRSQIRRTRREQRATLPCMFELIPSSDDGLLEISEMISRAIGWLPSEKVVRAEVEKMSAGQLAEWIQQRLCDKMDSAILRSKQISRLREILQTMVGVQHQAFPMALPLNRIVFREGRRNSWTQIRANFGRGIPPLELTGFTVVVVRVVALAIAITSLVLLGNYFEGQGIKPPEGMVFGRTLGRIIAVCLALSFIPALTMIVRPFFATYPPGCQTVGELARLIEAQSAQDEAWSRADLWQIIRDIVARVHGVPVEQVNPNTPIVRTPPK